MMEPHTMEHRLTTVEESVNYAHKRINENDALTNGIHELAADIKLMSHQLVEHIKRSDANNTRVDERQKSQGERIGKLETDYSALVQILKEFKSSFNALDAKLDTLEKEPGQKWKTLVSQVTTLIIAAIISGVIAFISK